jgi:hypothetical protein
MLPVDWLDTLSHSPLAEGRGRKDDTNRTRRGRPTTLIADSLMEAMHAPSATNCRP